MLTVFGRQTSSNVQAVMWLIAELSLPHHRLDAGGPYGGTDTDEFRVMNPMGRVPVIQDDDVTLFESQAILRYLSARHDTQGLWPTDPIGRAPIDQWMEWSKVHVAPVLIYKVFWQLIRTSAADRDERRLSEGVSELRGLMSIADAQIANHGWLAGPRMSLADISFGTLLFRYFTVGFQRADLPHLRAYYERLTARPAYAEHVMVSYDSLRVPGS